MSKTISLAKSIMNTNTGMHHQIKTSFDRNSISVYQMLLPVFMWIFTEFSTSLTDEQKKYRSK